MAGVKALKRECLVGMLPEGLVYCLCRWGGERECLGLYASFGLNDFPAAGSTPIYSRIVWS